MPERRKKCAKFSRKQETVRGSKALVPKVSFHYSYSPFSKTRRVQRKHGREVTSERRRPPLGSEPHRIQRRNSAERCRGAAAGERRRGCRKAKKALEHDAFLNFHIFLQRGFSAGLLFWIRGARAGSADLWRVGCLAVSPASTHQMRGAPPAVTTNMSLDVAECPLGDKAAFLPPLVENHRSRAYESWGQGGQSLAPRTHA